MSTRNLATLTVTLAALAAGLAHAGGSQLNTPSRSFHTGNVDPSSAYRPEAHAMVDLNNDGFPDIVCAHQGNFTTSARFSVQMNEGGSSYAAAISYPAGGETMDVVGGDFDGDGWNDVALTRTSNSFSGQQVIVLLNDQHGVLLPLTAWPCGRGPTSLVSFDVDGDGDLDLVTANSYWGEDDVSVLKNDGQAQFAVRDDYALGTGSNPWRIAAGDVDGDGDVDVATTFRDGAPGVCILHNDGLGRFTSPQVLPSPATYILPVPGLALADVDRDQDVDVVYAASGQGGYALFRNNGGGTFAAPINIGSNLSSGSANDLDVADVTLDGWPDVLGVGYGDKYGFSLVPGNGSGGFGPGKTLRTGEMAHSITATDVDLDGDRDVVVANYGSLNVTVHVNQLGQISLPPVAPVGFSAIQSAVGDIDRDGDLDLVAADSQLYRLVNDGAGNMTSYPGGTTGGGVFASPELADFTGDSYPDLISLRSGLVLHVNAGNGTFFPWVAINGGASLKQCKPVDFDGDGLIDVVSAAQGGFGQPNLYAVRNLGGGQWSAPIPSTNTSISAGDRLVTGDINRDGTVDVVTTQGGAVGIWIGNGTGAFVLAAQPSLGNGGASYIAAGDLDNDGDLDVVAASIGGQYGPSVTVIKNNGSGTFGAPTTYVSLYSLQYSGVAGLTLVDCDQDGDLDVAAGSYGGNGVSLFENTGNGTLLPEARYGVNGAVINVTSGDFDGDGRGDVVANLSTEPPMGGGVSILFGRPAVTPVSIYCAGKLNSIGCTPAISAFGAPSATQTSGFVVQCANTRNEKAGLLLNGISGRASVAFAGGILCVNAPRRGPAGSSGGTPLPASDCTGTYSVDMNAYARGLLPATPWGELSVPGTVANCQFWARDPGFAAPNNAALSNAVEYTVGP